MSIIEQCKVAGKIRDKEASKILLECSSLVQQQIKPPADNFLEILDIALQVTEFHSRKNQIPSESQLVGDILLKICSYMQERSKESPDSKELIKELIILNSRLYANIVLNEIN